MTKILEIDDDMVGQVVSALAKRAKYFENASASARYGSANVGPEDIIAWDNLASRLWGLVRVLGEDDLEPPVKQLYGYVSPGETIV